MFSSYTQSYPAILHSHPCPCCTTFFSYVDRRVYGRHLSHLDVVEYLRAAVGRELRTDNDHNVLVPARVSVEPDRRPPEAGHRCCWDEQHCQQAGARHCLPQLHCHWCLSLCSKAKLSFTLFFDLLSSSRHSPRKVHHRRILLSPLSSFDPGTFANSPSLLEIMSQF